MATYKHKAGERRADRRAGTAEFSRAVRGRDPRELVAIQDAEFVDSGFDDLLRGGKVSGRVKPKTVRSEPTKPLPITDEDRAAVAAALQAREAAILEEVARYRRENPGVENRWNVTVTTGAQSTALTKQRPAQISGLLPEHQLRR